jgi:CRISPR/Cas system endoribonuclease Cas6 (RAMP superfamily)
MAKIRKLTPAVLKQIIKEEKQKLQVENKRRKSTKSVETSIDQVTKMALIEAKYLLRIKKLRETRNLLKKQIARKTRR